MNGSIRECRSIEWHIRTITETRANRTGVFENRSGMTGFRFVMRSDSTGCQCVASFPNRSESSSVFETSASRRSSNVDRTATISSAETDASSTWQLYREPSLDSVSQNARNRIRDRDLDIFPYVPAITRTKTFRQIDRSLAIPFSLSPRPTGIPFRNPNVTHRLATCYGDFWPVRVALGPGTRQMADSVS